MYLCLCLHQVKIGQAEEWKIVAQIFLGSHFDLIFSYPGTGCPYLCGGIIRWLHIQGRNFWSNVKWLMCFPIKDNRSCRRILKPPEIIGSTPLIYYLVSIP